MSRVVITGAADGIGRALALHYADCGAVVAIVDRDAVLAGQTRNELSVRGADGGFFAADLADPQAIAGLVAQLADGPPIDLLVHSAGISAVGHFAAIPPVQQQAVIDINLRAPMLLSAGLLQRERIAPGATIVFIASLSVFVSYPGAPGYAASKDGLAAYARSLRPTLRRQRINVLTVYPGPTRTAHARRYSPDNRRENRRMPPETLAHLIAAAVTARRRELVPGAAARIFALLGRRTPRLAEWAMRKTLLDRMI
jgi:cyclic-di-GMP-binding biofilm dispersal mediator protein